MTLTIREGRYYRTRDGRKVGPMERVGSMWRGFVPSALASGLHHFHPDGAAHGGALSLDLIAEWPDEPPSPVRTVTRKEIVLGTYGRVSVANPHESRAVDIMLDEASGISTKAWSRMSADQLRAAAKVFTDLADALEDGASA